MSKHFESEAGHESISDEELAEQERSNAIQRIINSTPNFAEPEEGFTLNWGKTGVGFGQATFYCSDVKDGEMKLYCDSETMSREFVKEMLCNMVDNAVFVDEE